MKKDKVFEKQIINLLSKINEQEEIVDNTGQPNEIDNNDTTLVAPELGSGTGNKKIKYINTPNLFTTAPGPGGSTWSEEDKRWLLPLKDGRVGAFLVKEFSNFFKNTGRSSAARILPYQFKIILGGTIDLKAKINAIVEENKTSIELIEVSSNTPHGFEKHTPQGSGDESGWSDQINSFNVSIDASELVSAPEKAKDGEGPNALEAAIDVIQAYNETVPEEDMLDINDSEIRNKIEKAAKSAEKEDININPKNNKFSRFIKSQLGIGTEIQEFQAAVRGVTRWVNRILRQENKEEIDVDDPKIKRYLNTKITPQLMNQLADLDDEDKPEIRVDDPDFRDAVFSFLNNKYGLDDIEGIVSQRNKKEESSNLHKYLTKILLEAKGDKALEKELGGDIVVAINNKMFDEWFSTKRGIAANTTRTYFEGNLFEFLAVRDAVFKPTNREIKEQKGSKTIIQFEGEIQCEGEIWIDARVGEVQGRLDTWTFRDHDQPNKPFARKTFGLGRLVPRTGPGASQEVKNVNPKGAN